MKKLLTLCFFLVFFTKQNYLLAQEKIPIKFGKVTVQDFDVKPPSTDSAANAIIIADWGNSEFVSNPNELSIGMEFSRKTRIKIVNKNGLNAATHSVFLFSTGTGNTSEKLESLKAATYNLEDGKVVETKLESSSVFTENANKNLIIKKFTFPAVKEGSIVEYSYIIRSGFSTNLRPWVFQGEYPCLWSEYNASIPEFYKYVTLAQGYQPFLINTVDQSSVNFSFTVKTQTAVTSNTLTAPATSFQPVNISGSCDNHRWVMKNVPGLKVEPFTTTLMNHIAKIEFQLTMIQYPRAIPTFYMNDWKKVAEQMNQSEKFGELINRSNGWLDDNLKEIVGDAGSQLEKARKIFQYLRDNITKKTGFGVYAPTTLREVWKNKAGTEAEINLLLIAMLRNEKIESFPIILGTRNLGFTNELYPLMGRYNYLIVKAVIDGQIIYLDASHPRIGFGKLPLECYNGHAREVTKESLFPVYFYADSVKEYSVTNNFIMNDEKGRLVGSTTQRMGYYSSLMLRNELATKNIEDYKKPIRAALPENVEASNFEIDSIKSYDDPITVRYDTKYKGFGEDDIVYFNPLMEHIVKTNPFSAAQRFYPVEMPYTKEDIYVLNMEIPKGYIVDETPKSTRLLLNENEGMFEYIVKKDAQNIQLRMKLMINKANFKNEDYETLRDFYSFIVKKQAEQIVFKKVK